VDGLSDTDIETMFRAARDADYSSIAEEARELESRLGASARKREPEQRPLETDVARLRRRLGEVVAIDFFDSLGRQSAEGLVASLEARLNPDTPMESTSGTLRDYKQRVWVTRKGIHIDRMASAWLIKRFIDPDATFKFVPARGYSPEKGEIRFDMFEAEFTHEGDHCTYEVLLRRLQLEAGGLRQLAEIIHDIDLKDGKFGRAETPGIEQLITGMCAVHKDDETRLARSTAVFDDLHASFARRSR
jgi:hypothetical protein